MTWVLQISFLVLKKWIYQHLIKNKTYLFFSHTSKVRQYIGQVIEDKAIVYKKELLKEVIKKEYNTY